MEFASAVELRDECNRPNQTSSLGHHEANPCWTGQALHQQGRDEAARGVGNPEEEEEERKEEEMIYHILAACFILAYFAAPATADMIAFGWRSPEGTYEYTDDINRVPVAHLHSVQRIEVDGLTMYRYYTKVESEKE
jgi:hypothetical protein